MNFFSIIGYALGVGGAIIILFSKVKDDNLRDLKERVEILERERQEAHKQHVENQRAIANLEGQLQTYKEIPLKKIADSLSELSMSNHQILTTLQGSAVIAAQERDSQVVKEQTVEHQTVKSKERV